MGARTPTLGRDHDPRVPSDLSPLATWSRKAAWRCLEGLGLRRVAPRLFPRGTLCYFDARRHPGVRGMVAFTVDDGFCGLDNPGGAMVSEVRALFARHGAKATFFIAGTHCEHVDRHDVLALLADGHELANHSGEDRPYHRETAEAFAADLDQTQRAIAAFQPELPPWYRAPHARVSPAMVEVLSGRGMTHVMVDAFAHDTAIPDPGFIARSVLRQVQDGSILLVHMPERGVREWNLEAMEGVLDGLAARGLKAVTVTELVRAARG